MSEGFVSHCSRVYEGRIGFLKIHFSFPAHFVGLGYSFRELATIATSFIKERFTLSQALICKDLEFGDSAHAPWPYPVGWFKSSSKWCSAQTLRLIHTVYIYIYIWAMPETIFQDGQLLWIPFCRVALLKYRRTEVNEHLATICKRCSSIFNREGFKSSQKYPEMMFYGPPEPHSLHRGAGFHALDFSSGRRNRRSTSAIVGSYHLITWCQRTRPVLNLIVLHVSLDIRSASYVTGFSQLLCRKEPEPPVLFNKENCLERVPWRWKWKRLGIIEVRHWKW